MPHNVLGLKQTAIENMAVQWLSDMRVGTWCEGPTRPVSCCGRRFVKVIYKNISVIHRGVSTLDTHYNTLLSKKNNLNATISNHTIDIYKTITVGM